MRNYSILKFGNICEVDYARGTARVDLDEDGITTAFLPIAFPMTLQNKSFAMPAINSQVCAVMDENAEQGIIIGATYSDIATPDGFSEGLSGVLFSDGSKVVYNEKTQEYTVNAVGRVEIIGGSSVKIANEVESLKSVLSDLIDALLSETHTAPSGVTSTPLNSAQYAAIKTRINALLS